MLIWDDHVGVSSSIRPRYFTCFEIYICWPLILKLSFFGITFSVGWNIISVLSTLMDILLVLSYFLSNFYLSPNNSPSKNMKNVFYFVIKALFVLEIFKFLYFCLPLFFSLSAIALVVDGRKILKFMLPSNVQVGT